MCAGVWKDGLVVKSTHTAFAEDWNSILKTAYNSSSGGSEVSGLGEYLHAHVHTTPII